MTHQTELLVALELCWVNGMSTHEPLRDQYYQAPCIYMCHMDSLSSLDQSGVVVPMTLCLL